MIIERVWPAMEKAMILHPTEALQLRGCGLEPKYSLQCSTTRIVILEEIPAGSALYAPDSSSKEIRIFHQKES